MIRPVIALGALALSLGVALPALAAEPLTLEAAIKRAIAQHPDLVTAESQAKISALAVDDAAAQRFQLTSEVSGLARGAQGGIGTSPLPASATTQTLDGNVTITVPLFTGFKVTNGIIAAEHSRDAAGLQRDATKSDVTWKVTQAFWTLRRAELAEEIQAVAVQENEHTLALAKTGFTLGRQLSNEVDRAEVDLLSAKGTMLQAQSDTQQARLQLAALVGMAPGDLAIAADPDAMALPTLPPGLSKRPFDPAVLEAVVEARAEVKAAKAQVEAAEAQVGVARGDRWPQLAFVSSLQVGNNPYDPALGSRGLANAFTGLGDVRLAASWNLFDAWKTERAVARAEGSLVSAQASLERSRREIRTSVAGALVRWTSARDRRALAERGAGIAEKTLTWVQARYQQGYSLQVEVNQAIGSLVSARSQRVNALVDELIARSDLERALGQL